MTANLLAGKKIVVMGVANQKKVLHGVVPKRLKH